MAKVSPEILLKDRKVIEEINRHLWIESERAGVDIGFDRAAEDWMKRFSSEWIRVNRSNKTSRTKRATTPKKRRAKSYL